MTGHVLSGGMANAGAVVRRGSVVERPAQPHAAAIHTHLRALAAHGFDGVPTPMGTTADGSREQLSYVHGDVPVPPHPPWAWTDDALRSVGALLRQMHRAAASAPIDRAVPWPTELADPEGPEAAEGAEVPLLCHNDVCLENVVFRDGRAYALIDFDQAAPGRPVWDVAMTARYWVTTSGREGLDRPHRLSVLADAYGLGPRGRAALPGVIEQATAVCRAFVARRVAGGDAVYVRALEQGGGWARWDRHQDMLVAQREAFAAALAAT
ncbi:phosphotransferase enzyme family protein [Streptomyces sp. NPDC058620]|uniref:phosphotransferase enzyme family protein n=1 Tax=Streptomyces sp. NPDC058620 TaxID=3346560 RepID=UPI003661C34B